MHKNFHIVLMILLLVMILLLGVFNYFNRMAFEADVFAHHHAQSEALRAEMEVRTVDRFTGTEGEILWDSVNELSRRINEACLKVGCE